MSQIASLSGPKQERYLRSYDELRALIGVMGMALPIVLPLGAMVMDQCSGSPLRLRSSLSYHYYTGMGGVFVGFLWAWGAILVTYRGPHPADNILSNVAGVCAIAVALFPTSKGDQTTAVGIVHYVAATIFFLSLIVFSGKLFRLTTPDEPIKKKRRAIYLWCAVVMGAAIAGILVVQVLYWWKKDWYSCIEPYSPVFWLEAVAVFAFGFSWLTKSEKII